MTCSKIERGQTSGKNMSKVAKSLISLELASEIDKNTRQMHQGRVNMNTDCFELWELVVQGKVKASSFAGNSGAHTSRIREVVKKAKI